MAKKITSSPSPTDVRLYQEASARFQTDKTAFQAISADVRLTDQTRYADPYLKFLAASGDPLAATEEFNRLYAGLISAPASAGTKYPNAFEELQSLLRDKGLSKGKTAIGQVDWAADGADIQVNRIVYDKDGKIHFVDKFQTHYEPWRAVCEYGPGIDDPEKTFKKKGLCQG